MIKVNQYYYERGIGYGLYTTRVVYVNKDDISTLKEYYSRDYDCKSKIVTKTDEVLDCKESVDEIYRMIESEGE